MSWVVCPVGYIADVPVGCIADVLVGCIADVLVGCIAGVLVGCIADILVAVGKSLAGHLAGSFSYRSLNSIFATSIP